MFKNSITNQKLSQYQSIDKISYNLVHYCVFDSTLHLLILRASFISYILQFKFNTALVLEDKTSCLVAQRKISNKNYHFQIVQRKRSKTNSSAFGKYITWFTTKVEATRGRNSSFT